MVTIEITRKDLKQDLDMFSKQSNHLDFNDYIGKRIQYKKSKDNRYVSDIRNMTKRICTDAYSEVMMYYFTDCRFIPNFTIGQSKKYNIPDFDHIGLNLGLKTSDVKNPHLIQKPHNVKYDELLSHIEFNEESIRYTILGVATVDVMREYGDENLVISPTARPYKNGFNRYDLLQKVYCFSNLTTVYDKRWQIK
jgi:hypothetical protein